MSKLLNVRTPFFLLFSIVSSFLFAQKSDWKAVRCSGVERIRPVYNVQVNADNSKMVANDRGLYQVQACDLSNFVTMEPGERSVLHYFGGNVDVRWTEEALKALIKEPIVIYGAYYDAATDFLMLGTEEYGLYILKTKPQLQLVDRLTTANSKLKSNNITNIFKDPAARFWIGSEQGLLIGSPGKWKADLIGYGVQRVRARGNDVYVLADGELWLVEGGEKWRAIPIEEGAIEKEPRDFDFDANGTLWLLSSIIAKYDLLTDDYTVFDGVQDYTSEFGTCIAADQSGHIWVGTRDKGLYHLGPQETMAISCTREAAPSCAGPGNDGVLLVKISGGTPPFTYEWSNTNLKGENPRNAAAGNYSVTVTDSKGLTNSAKITVDDPRITATARQTRAESGAGKSDGKAEVEVTGGSGTYSFRWDNGETVAQAVKLKEGTHTVTVTDKGGCTAVATVKIAQTLPELNASIAEKSPVRCAGQEQALLVAEATGGKEPYTFAWSNPALQGGQPELKLAAGTYTVTVTDAAGSKATASLTVQQPAPLSAVVLPKAPASTGAADGKAAVSVRGGTPPLSYKWDNGESTENAVKLPAGKHSVTVTDGYGCTITAEANITEDILPLEVNINALKTIRCNGAKDAALEVLVSGGKPPYTYGWSDANLSGEKPAGVGAGSYQITVTDALKTQKSATLVVREPAALTVNAEAKAPASTGRSDGQANAKVKGGIEPYSYAWDNGEAAAAATKLGPGTRSLTVTDANGCTATAGIEITENILPLKVSLETVGTIACAGQTVALKTSLSGGKPPFNIAWSDPALSGETPEKVQAGNYTVTVTDAVGTQYTATIALKAPAALSVAITVKSNASTNESDGQAIAKATGGTAPFTYAWDNGEKDATAVKLAPGSRKAVVTDANGCTAEATVEITETILPLAVKLNKLSDIRCAGQLEGALQAEITGGKSPFKITWNNPDLGGEKRDRLTEGEYTITVTDVQGTTATATATITSPDSLLVDIARRVGTSTERTKDGKATVEIKGGKPAYTIAWDNGETTATAKALTMGAHSVTVTDANGCRNTQSFELGRRIMPDLTPSMLSTGQTLRMERLLFEADSSRLTPECLPVLDEVYDFLAENGGIVIEIGGHTNSTPPDEFCDRLSTARSKSVADYLVGKGIDPKRVVYKGYGKRVPIASNATPEGRRLNQRVEIKILKLQ
jgi:outer membrane protein OmpA-like peptidoglycan-associated protein